MQTIEMRNADWGAYSALRSRATAEDGRPPKFGGRRAAAGERGKRANFKFLTVRSLMSPGGCRKAAVHAATFSHFRHIEPSSGWLGHRLGEETAPCLGCLRRLPPEGGVPRSREETALCLAARGGEAGARAGLASAGRSADAPACGQAVGSRLARTRLDLGRARWRRGNAERMNGKAKCLSDRNTFFTCFTDERGSGLAENL